MALPETHGVRMPLLQKLKPAADWQQDEIRIRSGLSWATFAFEDGPALRICGKEPLGRLYELVKLCCDALFQEEMAHGSRWTRSRYFDSNCFTLDFKAITTKPNALLVQAAYGITGESHWQIGAISSDCLFELCDWLAAALDLPLGRVLPRDGNRTCEISRLGSFIKLSLRHRFGASGTSATSATNLACLDGRHASELQQLLLAAAADSSSRTLRINGGDYSLELIVRGNNQLCQLKLDIGQNGSSSLLDNLELVQLAADIGLLLE